jgi:hypothetical protein
MKLIEIELNLPQQKRNLRQCQNYQCCKYPGEIRSWPFSFSIIKLDSFVSFYGQNKAIYKKHGLQSLHIVHRTGVGKIADTS